jgi:hypothetical protein
MIFRNVLSAFFEYGHMMCCFPITIEFKFLESSRIRDELKHRLKELTNEIAPFLTII